MRTFGKLLVVWLTLAASVASAQTFFPGIRLRGQLTALDGTPVSRLIRLTVSLHDSASAPGALYSEVFDNLLVNNGLIDVMVGAGQGSATGDLVTALSPASGASPNRYLGMQVDDEPFGQRHLLTGVPTAASAANAVRLGGQPAEDYVTAAELTTQLSGYAQLGAAQTFSQSVTFSNQASFTTTSEAPFTVSSTTVVQNLNADLIDGISGELIARLDAANVFVGMQTFEGPVVFAQTSGAPFSVSSNSRVDNLNCQYVDGLSAAELQTCNACTDATNLGGQPASSYLDLANHTGTLPLASLPADVARRSGGNVFTGAQEMSPASPAGVGLIVRGQAAQTAHLQQWQGNDGTPLAYIDPAGVFHGTATDATNATNASTATTATSFSGSLSGDVSGTQSATSVDAIRGRAVASTAPASGQYLRYNGTQWSPASVTTTDLSGTVAVSQGGTGATTASGARTSLGAAASGSNADITSLSSLSSISTAGGLSITAPLSWTGVASGTASSATTATTATSANNATNLGGLSASSYARSGANTDITSLSAAQSISYGSGANAATISFTGSGTTRIQTASANPALEVRNSVGTTVLSVGTSAVSGTFSGNGSALTDLNASSLASGNIPNSVLTGTSYTGVTLAGTLSGSGTFTSGSFTGATTLSATTVTGTNVNGGLFTGDGSGLTNVSASVVGLAGTRTSQPCVLSGTQINCTGPCSWSTTDGDVTCGTTTVNDCPSVNLGNGRYCHLDNTSPCYLSCIDSSAGGWMFAENGNGVRLIPMPSNSNPNVVGRLHAQITHPILVCPYRATPFQVNILFYLYSGTSSRLIWVGSFMTNGGPQGQTRGFVTDMPLLAGETTVDPGTSYSLWVAASLTTTDTTINCWLARPATGVGSSDGTLIRYTPVMSGF